MSSDTTQQAAMTCPEAGTWLAWLGDRAQPDAWQDRAEVQAHLGGCAACRATVDDVRRYQTLLLRGRPSPLHAEERAALDERVFVSLGHWQPAPQTSPRLIWSVAIGLATVLVTLVAWTHARTRPTAQTMAQAVVSAPGLWASTVEGAIEYAGKDGRWHDLRVDDVLDAGVKVRARTAGRLVVPGRFELRLQPGTELEVLATTRVERAQQSGDAAFQLNGGEVDCAVVKRKPTQRFVIMFGGHRASVVGTRFTVRHVPDDGEAAVVVSEGAVRVDDAEAWNALMAGDTTTMVRAGQRWQYSNGRLALEPIPSRAAVTEESRHPASRPLGVQPEPAQVAPPAPATAATSPAVRSASTPRSKTKPAGKPRNFLIEVPPQTLPVEEGR